MPFYISNCIKLSISVTKYANFVSFSILRLLRTCFMGSKCTCMSENNVIPLKDTRMLLNGRYFYNLGKHLSKF